MGVYLMADVNWAGYLWVALGLGFVIFVHELGHFLVAKLCGVKCEKFYVGFDVPLRFGPLRLPSRLARFRWGETEYGVGIIPLGGYVKMLGQDDDPRNVQKEAERIRVPRAAGEEEGAGSAPSEFRLDPRSFPAKPVPHRMAIISAGVIMNLIFAVLFASWAFSSGVPYSPTEIGGTVPGGPAWEAGLEPGSRIIQIGHKGEPSESLRFDWDLSQAGVILAQDTEDLPLLVRGPDRKQRWVELRPVMTQLPKGRIPMIGVAKARTLDIGLIPTGSARLAAPPLKPGDRLVSANGISLENALQFERICALIPDQPLRVTVERKVGDEGQGAAKVEQVFALIPPNPLKRLGLVMRTGPVTGFRPDSPAAQAGFRAGDLIVQIDDQPPGDPMSLPDRLRAYYGEEVVIRVRRGAEELDLRASPQQPTSWDWTVSAGFPMAAESIGLAFAVTLDVAGVEEGTPAHRAGIEAGDRLTGVRFLSEDPDKSPRELVNRGRRLPLSEDGLDWMYLFQHLQWLQSDDLLEITYQRGDQERTATLKPFDSDVFNPDRGLFLKTKEEIHEAGSVAEALALGWRQTWEDATRVLRFLKKLFTGGLSPTNLGGPLSIVVVAGSEASQGLPRLLMFLTFLSANLAVLNFLPIPVLDGGHMLFLAAEGIRGKPVDERMQFALTLAGFAFLLGLMVFVLGLDIDRLFL